MAASTDLNWEENLMSHWMANTSRAGVILNPAFHSLKSTRAVGFENVLSGLSDNSVQCSKSTSLHEVALHKEKSSESRSPCGDMLDTSKRLSPTLVAKEDQMLMIKDVSSQWITLQTDLECDQLHDLDDEGCSTGALLQKLEQLKELQQHKQKQLKRHQMEEIQRLKEEQEKLFSTISEQQAHTEENSLILELDLLGHACGDSSSEDSKKTETSESLTRVKCSEAFNVEERPIPVSIQESKQTYEEFLDEQIRLEEQRLSEKGNTQDGGKSTCQKPVIKRPFLKRGEGLNRFTGAKSKAARQKENQVPLQSDILDVKNSVKVDKQELHRKIAPSNKEQTCDNFTSKNAKTKKACVPPARKTAVLKSCLGKCISSSTRKKLSEKKVGQPRDTGRGDTNDETEKNKENVMALANVDKIGSKFSSDKYEHPSELIACLTNTSKKDPDFSFDLSFQKKLENWDVENEKEKIELDEFLFLEQAADEISFASNSSLIIRILDQGQQISTRHRLSSTPIKSRQQEQQVNFQETAPLDNRNREQCIFQQPNETEALVDTDSQAPDSKTLQTVPPADFQDFSNIDTDENKSIETSDSNSEFEEEFETTIKPLSDKVKNLFLNNGDASPRFSECLGKNKTMSRDASLGTEKDLCVNQCSEINKPEPQSVCSTDKVEFDDEMSWSDFEENETCSVAKSNMGTQQTLSSDSAFKSEVFFPDKAIKRKTAAMRKGDATPKPSVTDSEVTAPPTTDLMLKLFPSLRPKQKVDVQQMQDAKRNAAHEESGDTAHSQLLREKLVELELEIERFREENASLTKLREEREDALAKFRKEVAEFEQQKAKELAQIEELKKEETRKLQKERKVFEKYAQAARAIPDKRERDEIQALKQQLAALQEDLKRREAKWSTCHARLRDQIETLNKENTELREEIKVMERCRLEAWKRKESSTNKKKTDDYDYSSRPESTHSPAVLQSSHTTASVLHVPKSSKRNSRSLSSEGRPFVKSKQAAIHEESCLGNTAMTLEDSSKTFTVVNKKLPDHLTAESSPAATPNPSDSEEEPESETSHPDGKVERVFKNGSHLIIFPNGTQKEVSCDGKITTITFFNGDVKQVLEDQRVVYYYADAKTTHTTYPTGLEVLHFSNGQIEKHFPDGRKEIIFPDQTIKNVYTDGQEVNIFPDGTVVRMQQDGSKLIEFSNGQQELHTTHFKRRKYPDGTIKTVYANGRQETQYASGRVRVKDKNGHVLMDTQP